MHLGVESARIKMSKKVKNMLKNNVVMCVLVVVLVCLVATVFAADVKIQGGVSFMAPN